MRLQHRYRIASMGTEMPRGIDRRYSQPDEVRLELNAYLPGKPVTDREWAFLVDRRYVDEMMDGQGTILEMRNDLQAIRETQIDRPPPRQHKDTTKRASQPGREKAVVDGTPSDGPRTSAVAELVAADAAEFPDVSEFRQRVWKGRHPNEEWSEVQRRGSQEHYPLSPAEAAQWVVSTVDAEQSTVGPSAYLEVGPLLLGDVLRAVIEQQPLSIPLRQEHLQKLEYRRLRIRLPDGLVETVPTQQGGDLERLRLLSDELAASFAWAREDATLWVLTGITPPLPPLTNSVLPHAGAPVLDRLSIQIDPHVPPADLATYYARVRQAYWQDSGTQSRQMRARLPDAGRMEMVAFVAPRLASGSDTQDAWRSMRHAWNRAHPQSKYASDQELRADYRRARRQLLGLTRRKEPRNAQSIEDTIGTEVE
jgi:hypothetical protein